MSDHDHRRRAYPEDDQSTSQPSQPSCKHGAVDTSNAREIVHSPYGASVTTRTRGQGRGFGPSNELEHGAGAMPFTPSLDYDRKESNKLEHSSGTVPFAPTMCTSPPTKLPTADHDIGSSTTPGAFSVLSIQDRAVSFVTVTDSNVPAENEGFIPEATTVEDSPTYALAYVTNDVDNGDPPTKTESLQRLTQGMRYGIVAGVLCVIALIVTLVVLFAANRPSAIVPTAAPAKVQYVLYKVAWTATIASDAALLTREISDLELTCLSGGRLETGLATTFLDGRETPLCTAVSDSTALCTQPPAPQVGSNKVLDASISFQCHGTNLDQLVGKAKLFNTTLNFDLVESGYQCYAFHMIDLQIAVVETGDTELDSICSDIPMSITSGNLTIGYCATDGSCTSNGVSECTVLLEGRSMVQRDPVNKKHIRDE